MSLNITDSLSDALRHALDAAGLPAPSEVQWEIPRESRHGDYATNVAMSLAREARRPPRKIAEAIVASFPKTAVVDRVEIAGPGFLNVFLSPAWCAEALHEVLDIGEIERIARAELPATVSGTALATAVGGIGLGYVACAAFLLLSVVPYLWRSGDEPLTQRPQCAL